MDVETPSTSREVENHRGDVSLKPALEHIPGSDRTSQLNTKPAKTTAQREEIVEVKKKEATRTGKQPCMCGSAPGSNAASRFLGELGATLPAVCKRKSVGPHAPTSRRY